MNRSFDIFVLLLQIFSFGQEQRTKSKAHESGIKSKRISKAKRSQVNTEDDIIRKLKRYVLLAGRHQRGHVSSHFFLKPNFSVEAQLFYSFRPSQPPHWLLAKDLHVLDLGHMILSLLLTYSLDICAIRIWALSFFPQVLLKKKSPPKAEVTVRNQQS